MPRLAVRQRGSILVEVSVASAVAAITLLSLTVLFLHANRLILRNRLTGLALNIISSQIDADAKRPLSDFTSEREVIPVTAIPGATLVRRLEETRDNLKQFRYVMFWDSKAGEQHVQVEHELTGDGLIND